MRRPATPSRPRTRSAAAAGPALRACPPGPRSATTSPSIPRWASRAGLRGYGLLLDISDVANPRRLFAAADSKLLVLALGHVQQRRLEGPVHGRVGRRLQPRCPRHGQAGVGSGRDLHPVRRPPGVRELLQDARAADHAGELRGAQRIADPIPGRDVMVQGCTRAGSTCSTGPTPGIRSRSRISTAAPWTPRSCLRGVVVRVLVQRLPLQLRDRAGLDVFRARAQSLALQNESTRRRPCASTTSTRRSSGS